MVQKSGWIFTTNQQTQNNMPHFPFTSNHPQHCLTNIPFFLARRIFIIVENENVKEKRFKKLKITLLEQKYPSR